MNIQQSVFRQTGLMIEGSDVKNGIQEAISKLSEPLVILEMATGTGKSLSALKLAQGLNTLIVCKQKEHFKTWEGEIDKWNINLPNRKIICYQSLSKEEGNEYDMIILDEVQGLSYARSMALARVRTKRYVALSATIPEEVRFRLTLFSKSIRIIRIPVNKAIEWKLIPSPKINVIECPLDNTRRYLKYQRHQKRFPPGVTTIYWQQWNQYKLKFMNLDVICTEHEYYQLLEEEFIAARELFFKQPDCKRKPENMSEQTRYFYNSFLQKGGMRKKFLGGLRTKYVRALMKKLEGQRLIVFANDIAQCDTLAGNYPTVHSKSDEKNVVEKFNNGKIDKLFSVNMLNESMNIEGEFSAILVSLGGSTIQSVQRIGRSVRNKNSQVYLFLTKNTRDSHYFDTFKQGLSDEYFTFLTLKDLI